MDIDIYEISSLDELKIFYSKIERAEETIKEELEGLYNKRIILSEDMTKLESAIPNLELLDNNSKSLSNMIIVAAELADNVSSKVRQLDLAKNRVHQCISRVEDILDLKACTNGAKKALDEGNYESAASFIKRFLDMDEEMLKLTEEEAENSLRILHSSTKQLKEIAITNVDNAILKDDFKSLERFIKIFPLLGEKKLGLEKFGSYLSGKINTEMRGQMKLSEVSNPQRFMVKFVDLMTVLLETVAEMIKKHQPFVESHYGRGQLSVLLHSLQKECDTWALTVLDRFRRERRLQQHLSQAHQYQQHSTTDYNSEDSDSAVAGIGQLEMVVSEIVLINHRVELFIRFLRRRLQTDYEAAGSRSSSEIHEECNRFFADLKMLNEMQGLINNYILMEEYFLKEMISKVIISKDIEDKSNISKIVDGVFFVVNKCIRRTLSSGSVEGACAMLNVSSTVLIDRYAEQTVQERLRQCQLGQSATTWVRDAYTSYLTTQNPVNSGPAAAAGASGAVSTLSSSGSSTGLLLAAAGSGTNAELGTSTAASRQALFIVYLNSAEASVDCIEKLKTSLAREIDKIFAKSNQVSRTKLMECLAAMSSSVTDKLREVVDAAIVELSSAIVKPQLRTLTQNLASMRHILTEEEFVSMEANDPWVEQFIINVQSMLTEFSECMLPAIYEKFMQKICEETIYRIEKIIRSKSFNKWGGIQFDRDIRTMINFFSSTTRFGVRERFTRLRQIANILNLESVTEIHSYWETMTWRLTPQEVRQFMALRSDFRTDDIRRLSLI